MIGYSSSSSWVGPYGPMLYVIVTHLCCIAHKKSIFFTDFAVKSTTGTTSTSQSFLQRQIQVPGTTFSTFSDKVRLEGGHENCCRFATLTGVHQGAHIRSPYVPCQIMDPWQSSELEQNDGISYKEKLRGRGGYSCRFECVCFIFLWAMQHR